MSGVPKLMFIDETWAATNMTYNHGRCPKGERLRMGDPRGHRKAATLVANLRMIGMVAPMGRSTATGLRLMCAGTHARAAAR